MITANKAKVSTGCATLGALMMALSVIAQAAGAVPARPTFYKDVAPIFQAECQECHRPAGSNYGGLIAPMSLVTYEEVRPWAKSIARQVTTKQMPPWDAHERHNGVFMNERTLSDAEIQTIVRWVAMSAPPGDRADAPPPRSFDTEDGWLVGKPDLVVTMREPYFVGDEVADLYAAFYVDLTEEMLPGDRWITGFQCKPGSNVVHHFNCMLLAPDEEGRLPEFQGFPDTAAGEIAPRGAGQYIGGTASGTDANVYPEGFGLLIEKGTRVTFDIHYHKEAGPGTGQFDRSEIGFLLTDKKPDREIGGGRYRGPIATYSFRIPPRAENFQVGPVARTYREPTDLLGLMPHLHLRGARARFEAFYPDGRSEILLEVPQYDFSWQTVYRYGDLKRIPAGTKIEFTAWFDNSPEKAAVYNFDADREVTFGPRSNDEMMMGFVSSSPAVTADASAPAAR